MQRPEYRPNRARLPSGFRASRRLGQHFLYREDVLRVIVEACALEPDDSVVEIGPGPGSLTKLLVERCARLYAVEIDPRLWGSLLERFGNAPGFVLVKEDVLRLDLTTLRSPGRRLVAVGNIPYSITSDLLRVLLDAGEVLARAVLTLQREVAERLVARPGDRAYGLLSVLTTARGRAEIRARVPGRWFHPPSGVGSAVVRLDLAESGPGVRKADRPALALAKAAFHRRRRKLVNVVASHSGMPAAEAREHVVTALGAEAADRRADSLSLEEFRALCMARP